MTAPLHAWYSDKQAELTGLVEYETVDGKTVVCTEVTQTADGSKWDDADYLCEVTRFVRRVSPDPFDRFITRPTRPMGSLGDL